MTDVAGSPVAQNPAAGDPAVGRVTHAERPRRAADVTLIGEMQGSGYREPPALARRGDGQTIQLTPLLYAVLDAVDGERDEAQVAEEVARVTGRPVSAENAAQLIEKLRESGLVVHADGSEPEARRSNPLLALKFKVAVTDEARTRKLITPFAWLFHPLVSLPLVGVFAWICWWLLFEKGLASATHEAFAKPGLLLAVLAVTILSAGFHEFGHAAGAQRGGATPGVMGAGLYLIWPAFYTDVTDSYRLGRWGRLRTDLGGLYFNAIVAVVSVACWWATGYDAILLLVASQILQMVRQLLPLVRFDGYHVLADLTGVPDLFHRIGPTLKGLVPGLAKDERATALKPWARAVVTTWVFVVIPVFAFSIFTLVLTLPRVVGTALSSAEGQRLEMVQAASDGDVIAMIARGAAALIVLLPVVASGYMIVRLGRRITGSVWSRTAGKPLQRGLAGLLALALVGGLLWAWWPSQDKYRPIAAWERGTLTDVAAPSGVGVGTMGSGTVLWPDDTPVPTHDHPQLAAVLIADHVPATTVTPTAAPTTDSPTATSSPDPGVSQQPTTSSPQDPGGTWIFPFDEPPAPDEGDNQALAVNTTDDTATYSVAFAMVWADGSDPAENTNSAYAIADCTNCAAIAVAFQVVFVVGDNHAAAPQNVSVAVNYDCTSCLTYSLAVQLFVTLDGPLSDEAMAQIDALWDQITEYGSHINEVPLSEIQDTLSGYEQQILDVVQADQGSLTGSPSPSDTASPSESATTSTSPTESPTIGSSESTSESVSPSPVESSGTTSPTTSESATPTTSSSTEPTATATTSPSAVATSSP